MLSIFAGSSAKILFFRWVTAAAPPHPPQGAGLV